MPTFSLREQISVLVEQKDQLGEKVRKIEKQLSSRINDGSPAFKTWRTNATYALTKTNIALDEINSQLRKLNRQRHQLEETVGYRAARALLQRWLHVNIDNIQDVAALSTETKQLLGAPEATDLYGEGAS